MEKLLESLKEAWELIITNARLNKIQQALECLTLQFPPINQEDQLSLNASGGGHVDRKIQPWFSQIDLPRFDGNEPLEVLYKGELFFLVPLNPGERKSHDRFLPHGWHGP